jgi:sugar/nucleoside kinase (ribokinase family)
VTLAVIGSLSRDLVDGGDPRPGGAVFYAARALRALGSRATLVTKCAPEHRAELLPALSRLGVPVAWHPAHSTTTFSFSYDGEQRRMEVAAVGDAWTAAEAAADLHGARWIHIGALLRSDFPPKTLRALGRGHVLSLDGQALVRPSRVGPLTLDADYDPAVLRSVRILKLSEEEALVVLGELEEERVRALGVAEVVVTLGSRGVLVFTAEGVERLAVDVLRGIDPTGAGDSFGAAYLAGRSTGHAPRAAARRAAAVTAGLLSGRLR